MKVLVTTLFYAIISGTLVALVLYIGNIFGIKYEPFTEENNVILGFILGFVAIILIKLYELIFSRRK